jgi:Bacterial transcriptional activator domain
VAYPPGAAQTLRSHLASLRKALGSERVAFRGSGYWVVVEPGELDAAVFEADVVDSLAALAGADTARGLDGLDQALGLWRGPALAEVADQPWAMAVRAVRLRTGPGGRARPARVSDRQPESSLPGPYKKGRPTSPTVWSTPCARSSTNEPTTWKDWLWSQQVRALPGPPTGIRSAVARRAGNLAFSIGDLPGPGRSRLASLACHQGHLAEARALATGVLDETARIGSIVRTPCSSSPTWPMSKAATSSPKATQARPLP